jgi:hypothetical protein
MMWPDGSYGQNRDSKIYSRKFLSHSFVDPTSDEKKFPFSIFTIILIVKSPNREMGNFIPSSRNIERFDRLMAQYSKFLTELSFLCDGDTPPELTNSIHNVQNAVAAARNNYYYYPSLKAVETVNTKFEELRIQMGPRQQQTRFIPEDRNREFIDLTNALREETIKCRKLFKSEVNGATFLGSATALFDYFILDFVLNSGSFFCETVKSLAGYANIAGNIAAAKAFVISAITKGIIYVGFSRYSALMLGKRCGKSLLHWVLLPWRRMLPRLPRVGRFLFWTHRWARFFLISLLLHDLHHMNFETTFGPSDWLVSPCDDVLLLVVAKSSSTLLVVIHKYL